MSCSGAVAAAVLSREEILVNVGRESTWSAGEQTWYLCESSVPTTIEQAVTCTDSQERPETEEMRREKHRGVYLDLFQVFVTQVLEGINKILFDFNIQWVLHFSQPLHRFASIKKRIAFEWEKEGKRKGERRRGQPVKQSRSLWRLHAEPFCQDTSVCKLRPPSTSLPGANLRAWHGASGARRESRQPPVGTDSTPDASLTGLIFSSLKNRNNLYQLHRGRKRWKYF